MHRSRLYLKSGILLFSFLASAAIYLALTQSIPSGTLLHIKIEEWYGFLSIAFLFLAALAGPLYRVFPGAPLKSLYFGSLGGFGISAFYFALLHTIVAFFYLLYGFAGIPFLIPGDLVSALCGFLALLILALLAGTSFTWAMKALGPAWKKLHRFVYVAILATLIHLLLIGNHYENAGSLAYLATLTGVLALLVLHAASIRRYLAEAYPRMPAWGWNAILAAAGLMLGYGLVLLHYLGHQHT